MKNKFVALVLGLVFTMFSCILCANAQKAQLNVDNDSFIDIDDLYPAIKYTFNGEKVGFADGIGRECVLFVASYADDKLVDARFRELVTTDAVTEITVAELGLDISQADTLKAFVMASKESLKPLDGVKTVNLVGTNVRDAFLFVNLDGTMYNGLAVSSNKKAPRENIVSGWIFDNRGGTARASIEDSINGVTDISDTQGAALIREFNKISDSVVTAEFSAVFSGNGTYAEFRDEQGNPTYSIKAQNDTWYILGSDGEYEYLAKKDNVGSEKFRIYLNLISGKSTTYIDDVNYGEHELLSDNIINFRFRIDEAGKGIITPRNVNMSANYGIYEFFDVFGIEEVYGWKSEGNVYVSGGEIVLSGDSSVEKGFSEIGTKYAADLLAIFPENENVSIKIKSNYAVSVELKTKNGTLYANDTVVYESLTPNMWYRLRVEADLSTGKATVLVNARGDKTVELGTLRPVNTFEVSAEGGNARIDEIKINALIDHDDYVAEPESKADLSDYIVAVNVCSLWKDDGNHYGWAYITPYDENKPVLGYYDEGSAESADWEIKYMVEHGIDVQAFCWYADVTSGPLKTPRLSSQLHEGYQLAKYEDYMKYCIIWEAASGGKFNEQQFRDYVIPYWFENYFLDENYLVIDNKPVLHVYAISSIEKENMFGSREQVKTELEYLEEVAKQYGYDGMIYISNGPVSTLEEVGIDAYAAYHWGDIGYTYEENVKQNISRADVADTVYVIPTISVGYNDYAWRSLKAPLMTLEDYEKCHAWVKDTYIPTYAQAGTWQEKMVWLSTWNEYGEGTYVMPAEDLHGFGYLDVLRDSYTNLGSGHADIAPNEAQGYRIHHLYPQYARHLRRQGDYTTDDVTVVYNGSDYVSVNNISLTSTSIGFVGVENGTVTNGVVSGTSNIVDHSVYIGHAEGTDISDTDAIRVRLKVPEGSGVKIYYATDSDTKLDEAKAKYIVADTSEVKDYIFYLGDDTSWSGTLTKLRIDPADADGMYFELHAVELMNAKEELIVNNQKIKSVIEPVKRNGEWLFPFDPETAVNYILHSFMNWNHDDKVLTIEANNHKVVYTVGRNTCTVDGAQKSLGYTLYQVDGLPMISYKTLAEALGFTFKTDAHKYIIETPESSLYDEAALGNNDSWEFDDYASHGWTSSNADLMMNDGYMRVDNTERESVDPSITKMFGDKQILASKYSGIEVCVKYEYASNVSNLSAYFITSFDSVWNETKRLKTSLGSTSSNGKYVTFTLDTLSNEDWYGYIDSLRIDPFDGTGYAEIDYIRLVENPDFDEATAEYFLGIINGNASNPKINTFTTNSSHKIAIVEDSTESGNYVYRLTGANIKGWTYIKHDYPFENGKKYYVSFRARAVSDSAGNKVDIKLVPNMQYPDDKATSGIHHELGSIKLPADGSWQYFEGEFTVSGMTSETGRMFTCYATPPSETTSASYEMDDIVLECIG